MRRPWSGTGRRRVLRRESQHAEQRHRETGVLVGREGQIASPLRGDLIEKLQLFRPEQPRDRLQFGTIRIVGLSDLYPPANGDRTRTWLERYGAGLDPSYV